MWAFCETLQGLSIQRIYVTSNRNRLFIWMPIVPWEGITDTLQLGQQACRYPTTTVLRLPYFFIIFCNKLLVVYVCACVYAYMCSYLCTNIKQFYSNLPFFIFSSWFLFVFNITKKLNIARTWDYPWIRFYKPLDIICISMCTVLIIEHIPLYRIAVNGQHSAEITSDQDV